MRGIFLFLALVPVQVFASEQELFYNIHQATRLLEEYSHGKCPSHYKAIQDHLVKADAELGTILLKSPKKAKILFEDDLRDLWDLYNRRATLKPAQLEALRLRIHEEAKLAGLKHQESWYKEAKLCDIP